MNNTKTPIYCISVGVLVKNFSTCPVWHIWRISRGLMSFYCYPEACATVHVLVSNTAAAATAAKSLQSCPTLCDPIDRGPPRCPVPGILQARTLEWVAISFSNAWKWKVKVKSLSHIRLFATPWTAAHQAPLSMGFSRQTQLNVYKNRKSTKA